MVHALREACRLLVPGGTLIDLRPYLLEAPLELVRKDGSFETAGMVDASLGSKHDQAAETAVNTLLGEGLIKMVSSEYFHTFSYWNSLKAMLADLNDAYKEDYILPEAVLKQAVILYKKIRPRPRLRFRVRSKLVVYKKP
jgi:hypothetical protein